MDCPLWRWTTGPSDKFISELTCGGYPRIVTRSDGEPSISSHVRAARAVTAVAELLSEVVQAQKSARGRGKETD